MKKLLSFLLVLAMLCTFVPTSVFAFDEYVIHKGQAGCRLTEFKLTEALNAQLLWDITFTAQSEAQTEGRVLVSDKSNNIDHPHIIGQSVIPTFTYEGTSMTFNGVAVTSDTTEVVLKAENEVVVYNGTTYAEYVIVVNEQASNGLPVVLIDTEGAAIPDKVNYVDSTISVLGSDIYGSEDIVAAVAGIKLRGNSTMGYDKKPYRIKFDKKQNVFNLGKAKSWVLLANYLDPAAIRNEVAYNFATRLNAYTAESTGFQVYVPRVRAVEVYLNNQFLGLYDMGDHVQVDGTRIAIDESGDELDDNDVQLYPQADVGYYLEVEDSSRVLAEYESEGAPYFTIQNPGSDDGTALYVQFKTPEFPSTEQATYITNYLQQVNDLINAQDEAVWELIDMDSFIDWYLANEVFKNTDSNFLSSVKMFKDSTDGIANGKLCMGPVWDFDIGSGAVSYIGESPTGWRTRSTENCAWYENLFQMNTFVTAVEKRWKEIRDNGIVEQIFTDIDNLTVSLGEAAEINYRLWHDNYKNNVYLNGTQPSSGWVFTVPETCYNAAHWIEQARYMKAFMSGRIAWIDEQFGYTASSRTLSGKAVIIGTGEQDEKLTASTLGVYPEGATVKYQWYANGSAISGATSATYTPSSADIGKSITVKISGSGRYSGTLTSDAVTVTYDISYYQTSQKVPFVSKTATTITVMGRTNYDVSVDGVNWIYTASAQEVTFDNLTPSTLYAVRYRHPQSTYGDMGIPGDATYVITSVSEEAPPAPSYIKGDADLSGALNTVDAKAILRHIAGANVLTGDNLAAADYNGDGEVNTSDVRELLKYIVSYV